MVSLSRTICFGEEKKVLGMLLGMINPTGGRTRACTAHYGMSIVFVSEIYTIYLFSICQNVLL
jgi:hypothetical protein